MFRLPDFSVVVWLRKTDGFAALKGELLALSDPGSSVARAAAGLARLLAAD